MPSERSAHVSSCSPAAAAKRVTRRQDDIAPLGVLPSGELADGGRLADPVHAHEQPHGRTGPVPLRQRWAVAGEHLFEILPESSQEGFGRLVHGPRVDARAKVRRERASWWTRRHRQGSAPPRDRRRSCRRRLGSGSRRDNCLRAAAPLPSRSRSAGLCGAGAGSRVIAPSPVSCGSSSAMAASRAATSSGERAPGPAGPASTSPAGASVSEGGAARGAGGPPAGPSGGRPGRPRRLRGADRPWRRRPQSRPAPGGVTTRADV